MSTMGQGIPEAGMSRDIPRRDPHGDWFTRGEASSWEENIVGQTTLEGYEEEKDKPGPVLLGP
jgi:hypothetical protein